MSRLDMEADFSAFVATWQHVLQRSAYLLCGDRQRAEDVVQIVLVRMYARWGRIQAAPGPLAYARRAVANAVVDEKRRPWRREVPLAELPDAFAVEDGPSGMDDAGLLAALATLGAGQRAVVVLRYVEDLDVDATAAALGISAGTVKSQASRGIAALRRQLAQPATQGTEENA